MCLHSKIRAPSCVYKDKWSIMFTYKDKGLIMCLHINNIYTSLLVRGFLLRPRLPAVNEHENISQHPHRLPTDARDVRNNSHTALK